MNKQYKKYLLSEAWINKKVELFKERGTNCELCGADKKIHVHHLHYKNIFNEKLEDLQVLFKSCHEKAHGIVPHAKTVKKKKVKKSNLSVKQSLVKKTLAKKTLAKKTLAKKTKVNRRKRGTKRGGLLKYLKSGAR